MNNEELVQQIQEGLDRKKNLTLLWEQNQGIINMIVHQLTGLQSYEEGFEDAKQQSFFGLLEAVNRYDPEFGVKFFTYAEGKIKKSIYRYHANTGYIVRVPEYLRHRMKKYIRFCQEYKEQNGTWPDDEICMMELSVSKSGIEHLKKLNCKMSAMSLEEKYGEDSTLADSIPAMYNLEELITESVYQKELHEILSKAIDLLPEEEKEVLWMRFYQKRNTSHIAKNMNCTPQNVSRLAKSAYKRIQAGEYAQELLSFLPERAIDRAIEQIQNSFKDLSEQERGLLL